MYLKGSKLNYTRRRKRSNPWRILALALLVGAALYFNEVVVPKTPPLFIPTPTPTRSPESFVSEAQTLETQGKINQAIQAYKKAAEVDPKNPLNYIAMARLQIYAGNYQEAATNAANALLLNPNNATAHALRGWALGFTGDFLEAEGALRRALELDPNNAAAYSYLAEVTVLKIQAGQGDLNSLQKAIESSRKAEELAPGQMETHRARGVVLEQTANYEEAVREFESAIARNPNIADLHLALGRNYRALQQYDKAVEEFNRANALNPTDPLSLTYISRTYATVGEYAKAIQFAQQALKISPDDPYLWGNLGQMLYRNREYPGAVSALRLAVRGGTTEDGVLVKGLPLDYGRVAEYYYTYGLALARRGECGEALEISRTIAEGVPNDETAIYNAQEIVNICKEIAQTPVSPPVETPTPASPITPQSGNPPSSQEATPSPQP